MPDGIFAYKAGGDEELIYANRALVDIFGCADLAELRNFVGNSFRGMVYPEDYLQTTQSIDAQLEKAQEFVRVDYRIKRKDGGLRWLKASHRLAELESYGKVFYAYVSDETELHELRSEKSRDKQVRDAMDAIHATFGFGDWSMDFDEKGEVSACNWSRKCRELMGYTSEKEFPDKFSCWADIMHPEDRERVLKAYWDVVHDYSGQKTYDIYYRLNTKHLGERWFRSIGRITRHADGRPISIYGIFLDVDDERRQAIEEKAAAQNLINAFSSTYTYTFVVDMAKGVTRPICYDKRMYELKGQDYTAPEHPYAIKEYADKNVFSEDRALFEPIASIENCRQLFADRTQYNIPYRLWLSGEMHYMELQMVKPSAERDEFVMGFKMVDEQEKLRQRQAQQERELLGIVRTLSSEYVDMYLINESTKKYRALRTDGVGQQCVAVSDNAEIALRGYVDAYVAPEDQEKMYTSCTLEYLHNNVPKKGIYSVDYKRKSGEDWLHYQMNTARFIADDGTAYIVLGFRNIHPIVEKEVEIQKTLQAAYNAAETANLAKRDFLQTMSHDIRTPMNGIIGMTAIAAAHIDDEERVKDCLQKITVASKHLLSLINEVLDMSKIESGKVSLTEEEFSLSELIDNMIAMVMPKVAAQGHEFNVNVHALEHEKVIGDSLRVQQVFMNIMGNAVKYTPKGGKISLDILELPCHQTKTGCYEFRFADTGIGMSEEYIKHIFEPFTRAEDGRISKIQGTGLGMTIAKNIVNMMGGDIDIKSKINEGTTFTVKIYLKLQDQEDVNYEQFIDLPVLVADDDELCMESVVGMLQDLGMSAEGVLSGEEAVVRAVDRHKAQNDYHAVVLDWKMPGMDGVATARAIRKEVGNDIPIIVLSAYDWSEIEAEARQAGVNAFVSKPLFKSRLVRLFKEVLDIEEETEGSDNPLQAFEEMDLSAYRCLLVEDNDLNAEIAMEILSETGMQVDRAVDGSDAVETMLEAEDGKYAMILMDIQMPKMNGYDATRAIRAMDSNYCRNVPIIAMTANAFAEDVQAAKTAGMNEHIAKPIDLQTLLKTINKWVVRKG